ncbi:MAG: HEAT repeat domain-containing protein [Planctomycetota bacterium]|nr:HEAT repeat domain-containing protein [Planctomycetota bacterium]MDA1113062.1 HEAT repeat domain-containing protein [Planctomycetota bacterium]
MLASIPALLLLAALQEPSSVPGAYRGPEDETLLQFVSHGGAETAGTLLHPFTGGWDRWEFWFEHERDVLFRGEPDFPARAVNDKGTYGVEDWSIDRQDLILTSIPLLIDALDSDIPAIREAAALSLGRIGYTSADFFLQRATRDRVESVRQAAYMGLGLLSSEDGIAFLVKTFEEETDSSTRSFAALGLGLSGRVEAGSALKSFLNSAYYDGSWKRNEDLALAAMVAAGVHGSKDFTPLLMNMLEAISKKNGSNRLVSTAIQSLGALGDSRARPMLEMLLQSKEHDVPGAAAQALGRLGDRAAVGSLAKVYVDSHDARLRSFCLLAIGRLGGRQADAKLKELRPEQKEEAPIHSAWALAAGMSRLEGSYPQLVSTLLYGTDSREHKEDKAPRRDEEILRGAAAMGLGLYGAPGAKTQLAICLNAKGVDPSFRGYLAMGLGMLATHPADELLLALVKEKSPYAQTRRGIAAGLGLSNSERTSVALVGMLISDPEDSVRWTAARGLATSRSSAALRRLSGQLRVELDRDQQDAQTAHLVLGLGFLGDAHDGATISSMLAGMDFRQEGRLFHALRNY